MEFLQVFNDLILLQNESNEFLRVCRDDDSIIIEMKDQDGMSMVEFYKRKFMGLDIYQQHLN